MMPVAKMMDPVMGVDIHIILIPTPGGPVPTPIPHPFIGMVFDPMEYVPFIGATVLTNSVPRAQAGSECKNIPPHIPMGGPFAKPPGNEGEVFMGSSTVLAEDEPLSFMAMPVISCTDIGVPPPPRPKKKGAPTSLMAPTSVVLPVPAGMPILVGGPPTVSLMAIGMRVGMSALKGLKKLQKGSKKWKKVSDKIHKAADAAMDKVGIKSKKARNAVHKGICTVTGHPVDIATGKVFTDHVDFELSGPIPLKWERVYFSTSEYQSPIGLGWHHPYDMKLVLDKSNGGAGLLLPDGRRTTFTLPEGDTLSYNRTERMSLGKDEQGYYVIDSNRMRFDFGKGLGTLPLARISNEAGDQISFTYKRKRLTQIIDSAGRTLTVKSDKSGRITAIHAPHPDHADETYPIVRYTYDDMGRLTRVTDPLDQTFRFEYQGSLLTKETDRNGLSFHFEYDGETADAKCIRTWGDKGIYDHKLTYAGGITVVENSLGAKTTHFHNGALVTKTIDPLGNVTLFTFNEYNQLLTETDPLGRKTTFQYDERGNLTQTTDPSEATTKLSYDEQDLLTSLTDANGGKWAWTYNADNQIASRVDPLGLTTEYSYNKGQLTSIQTPGQGITTLDYDKAHNLVRLTTADGQSSRWKYDKLGRQRVSIDPNANVQRRHFDLAGNVTRVDEPDGNRRFLTYDAEGNVIHAKDRQHDVRFAYAGMSRMVSRKENGTEIAFEYDTEENLIGIVNEKGRRYEFLLDENGNIFQESGFDRLVRFYERDQASQVVGVKVGSGPEATKTAYAYDEAGRITSVAYDTGETEYYAYRPDGELMEATNGATSIFFERDPLGRVLKEKQGAHEVFSEYDPTGNRIRLSSSQGADLHIKRNQMGDVMTMTTPNAQGWEVQFKRDALGLETSRLLPGKIASRWKRDSLGRPVEHQITGARKSLRKRTYTWSFNDRLKQLGDSLSGVTTFEHDAFGNLASAKYANGQTEHRNPDEVGNLFRTKDRSDRSYGPAGQLLEANGNRYEYDQLGNLTRKTTTRGDVWRYEWNRAGMLAAVTRPDGEVVSFTYDALGRRISKSYKGRTTHWVWDGNVILHEWVTVTPYIKTALKRRPSTGIKIKPRKRLTLANTPVATLTEPAVETPEESASTELITWLFEPESFTPIAKLQGDQAFSILTDHLGTPVAMYAREGGQQWAAETSIYGELKNVQGARGVCPFRYPGQYEDWETGLYYNRFRYYDAEGGMYVSQDRINQFPTGSIYNYVFDVNYRTDPLGLMDPWDIQFTQDSIGSTFADGDWAGRSLEEAIEEAKDLGKLPPGLELNVMELNGGANVVTLNNRTLYVAQQANLPHVTPNVIGVSGTNKLNKLLDGGAPLDVGEQPKVRC